MSRTRKNKYQPAKLFEDDIFNGVSTILIAETLGRAPKSAPLPRVVRPTDYDSDEELSALEDHRFSAPTKTTEEITIERPKSQIERRTDSVDKAIESARRKGASDRSRPLAEYTAVSTTTSQESRSSVTTDMSSSSDESDLGIAALFEDGYGMDIPMNKIEVDEEAEEWLAYSHLKRSLGNR